ncbi:MAG: hypothetical protein LBL30_03450 [Holosporales bacterium]|jgi:hypothetical protein|nr:hypothetical protein [Holosporales bacterium]
MLTFLKSTFYCSSFIVLGLCTNSLSHATLSRPSAFFALMERSPSEDQTGAVLKSSDGRTWEVVPSNSPDFAYTLQFPFGTAYGNGVHIAPEMSSTSGNDGGILISRDGGGDLDITSLR